MSNKPNDEPAFPVMDISQTQYSGMSLRDYFAAAALPALLADWSAYRRSTGQEIGLDPEARESALIEAFELADYAMKLRAKQCQPKQ